MFFLLNNLISRNKKLIEHRGDINSQVLENLLSKANHKIESMNLGNVMYKRIFTVMEEALGNIIKHSVRRETKKKYRPRFILEKINNHVRVTCGNLVENQSKDSIMEQIDHINQLRRNELKDLYKKKVKNATISDKGGAGLGFITVAKIVHNKISYKFEKVNDHLSYFILRIDISD